MQRERCQSGRRKTRGSEQMDTVLPRALEQTSNSMSDLHIQYYAPQKYV